MTKTVFIAHPISGDIRGNVQKVLGICEKVHTKDIIPVVAKSAGTLRDLQSES